MSYEVSQAQLLEAARLWHDAGCSVWPSAQDGTKRPMGVEWKSRMRERAPVEQLEQFIFSGRTGIGLICGAISGNLEMLELEAEATDSASLDKILHELDKRDLTWLWDELVYNGYSEHTPSGGLHMVYRVDGGTVPGNTKIARRPATAQELSINSDDKIKTLSETRGEGGYVVVAPSHGTVHPTGQPWTIYVGRPGEVPTIKWTDRCALHEAVAAALDQMPQQEWVRPTQAPQRPLDGSRPGDDFQLRVTWEEILEPHGWRVHHRTIAETFWTRPGKKRTDGWSASTGLMGSGRDDRLYVWSSSTVFNTERPYNKFSAYALLEHGGDFGAAARELGRRGYGDQSSRMAAGGSVPMEHVPHPDAQAPPGSDVAPVAQGTVATLAPAASRDVHGLPSYDTRRLAGMRWDPISIAHQWIDLHEDSFLYAADQKQWMRWSDTRWEEDKRLRHEYSAVVMAQRLLVHAQQVKAQNAEVGTVMEKEAKKLAHATQIQAMLRNARSDPRVAVCREDFDKDPNLLTLRNGVLNLETLQLGPHDPKMMLTRQINASYEPDAGPGRWDQFVTEVLPDTQVRDYVQRLCGYMLTGRMTERAMVLFYGESGSGKTQFLEALREVLGDFAGVAQQSTFQPRQAGYKGPSEDLHKLMGKRLVIQSELDAGTRFNEALVKSIVGADTQSTRALYGTPIDWQPEYTVFLATNHLPSISSSENAIWNRVKPIKFDQIFIDEHGQALNPSEKGLGRRMAQQEPEKILNWLLQGMIAYDQRGLDEPEQVSAWLKEYREDVDTARQFINEAEDHDRIQLTEGTSAPIREVYKAYTGWAEDNAVMPLGMRSFGERLESMGFERGRTSKTRTWLGINIATSGSWIADAQLPSGRKGFIPLRQ